MAKSNIVGSNVWIWNNNLDINCKEPKLQEYVIEERIKKGNSTFYLVREFGERNMYVADPGMFIQFERR